MPCRMCVLPNRSSDMIVYKDYWMSRTAIHGFKVCTKCPPPPHPGANYSICCSKHNKVRVVHLLHYKTLPSTVKQFRGPDGLIYLHFFIFKKKLKTVHKYTFYDCQLLHCALPLNTNEFAEQFY